MTTKTTADSHNQDQRTPEEEEGRGKLKTSAASLVMVSTKKPHTTTIKEGYILKIKFGFGWERWKAVCASVLVRG